MFGRTPTSTLLERVAAHIERLDRALKETENLLHSLKQGDRENSIRRLHDRLAGVTPESASDETAPEQPKRPFYRS